jgi:predicted RNase H-like HicB family nuclease
MKNEYTVIIEQDEDGYYVAEVPELYGCHTQAKSLDELMTRVREAIQLCREVQKPERPRKHLIGVQRIAV